MAQIRLSVVAVSRYELRELCNKWIESDGLAARATLGPALMRPPNTLFTRNNTRLPSTSATAAVTHAMLQREIARYHHDFSHQFFPHFF